MINHSHFFSISRYLLVYVIGIYSCEVYSSKYHFPSFKIKVSDENNTVSVVEYKYTGAKRLAANYPLIVTALAPIQYEMVKPSFSIMGMIMANPMMILMLFSFVMVFAMPKMLQGMTPEELEQIQKNSAMSGGDPMKNFSKLMGVPAAGDDEDD